MKNITVKLHQKLENKFNKSGVVIPVDSWEQLGGFRRSPLFRRLKRIIEHRIGLVDAFVGSTRNTLPY